jgi:hypothetical protein
MSTAVPLGAATEFRLAERPELVAEPERWELAHAGGWVWCSRCERAWPVDDLRLVYEPQVERAGYHPWIVGCADPRCPGASPGVDLLSYADLRQEAGLPYWPERPKAGQYLPLP